MMLSDYRAAHVFFPSLRIYVPHAFSTPSFILSTELMCFIPKNDDNKGEIFCAFYMTILRLHSRKPLWKQNELHNILK